MARYKHKIKLVCACGHWYSWRIVKKEDIPYYRERKCPPCRAQEVAAYAVANGYPPRVADGPVFGPTIPRRRQPALDRKFLSTYIEISAEDARRLIRSKEDLASFLKNPAAPLLILADPALALRLVQIQELP